MNKNVIAISACALLLTGCGAQESSVQEMQYIKSAVTYETMQDMYANPDNYLGKTFHIVGTLYPATDDDGEKFYSVYAKETQGDEGIGIELDWNDYTGLEDYDKITVEGTLERTSGTHDGQKIEYLILRVSMLEKRDQ